jgi:hypothetical protein
MIKKFADIDPFSRFILKGTVKVGCRAIKGMCPTCKRPVIGLKEGDIFHCSRCHTQITPKPGEGEFTQSLPYFLIPEDIKEILGAKPTSLTVVPAYTNLDRTIPNSYARYTRERRLFCTGDGVTAKRYDPATKRRVDHTPCGDGCADYRKGDCKPSATFYFYLPDVDVLSGFRLMTKSEATSRWQNKSVPITAAKSVPPWRSKTMVALFREGGAASDYQGGIYGYQGNEPGRTEHQEDCKDHGPSQEDGKAPSGKQLSPRIPQEEKGEYPRSVQADDRRLLGRGRLSGVMDIRQTRPDGLQGRPDHSEGHS